jgi:hypothetical protein
VNIELSKCAPAAVALTGGAILAATLFSQHPNRIFDRFRKLDQIGFWIPNWRFFAPEPAMSDFHILHRTLSADDFESPWEESHVVTPRKATHLFWFPDRRIDKGIFDVASELVSHLGAQEALILNSPAYRVLRSFVRHRIQSSAHPPLAGFQFLLARSTGVDTSAEPEEILTSPFIPWEAEHVNDHT